MVLDDATDVSAGRRMSVSTAPRNKAFERLRSLVEEDKRPLATEMEHEGHITRSIRHSSVQDWLRASSSTLSSPSQLASPPPPAAAGDDSGRAGAAKLAGRRGRGDDLIPFPTSPASSAVSSPRLPAAVASSCPNTAVPNACGAAWHGGGGGGGGGSSGSSGSVAAASRLGKRKSMDDGDERPGDPVARAQGYKRQAMSPSGLRAQIAFGRAKRTQPLAAPPRSGPASPLLLPRPPMAPPVVGAFSPLAPSRARSRSGAALTLNTGSLSVLQTNGVFSRMNIRDSTAAPADDDDDNDDQPKSAL
ncbi:hypothetical protein LPJ61_005326 [Coemansia biformis]|uniref:Uncharacterized protein n=1 Tax=Coemansia biformis TaxID=1286918 RepID=A0A9W7YA41_9FUNG|nr:hypothetical protein LPJ61_005326 [Coemansia biformis]